MLKLERDSLPLVEGSCLAFLIFADEKLPQSPYFLPFRKIEIDVAFPSLKELLRADSVVMIKEHNQTVNLLLSEIKLD